MGFKFNPITGKFDLVGSGGAGVTPSVWEKFSTNIVATTTSTVDTLLDTDFEFLQYIIHIRNATRTKVRSLNLIVHRSDTGVDDQVFSRMGAGLNVTIETQVNAGVFTLDVTNNEGETIEIRFARLFLK